MRLPRLALRVEPPLLERLERARVALEARAGVAVSLSAALRAALLAGLEALEGGTVGPAPAASSSKPSGATRSRSTRSAPASPSKAPARKRASSKATAKGPAKPRGGSKAPGTKAATKGAARSKAPPLEGPGAGEPDALRARFVAALEAPSERERPRGERLSDGVAGKLIGRSADYVRRWRVGERPLGATERAALEGVLTARGL